MTSYRISQLAALSGVPASTLRYYDEAGLLPAERADSGYRIYDGRSLQRLEFITSAKLLGLALDEVRDLLAVWEQDACAAMRERLLPRVRARIEDTDRRLAELTAFRAYLHGTCERLSGPAPVGGCRPGCGCVCGSADPAAIGPSSEGHLDHHAVTTPQFGDLECRLDEKALGHRCGEWRAVLGRAIAQETTADGARFSFPTDAELAVELSRLAAAEMTCCGFLDFTLQITAAGLTLTARAPEGAGQRVGDLLAVLA